MENKEKDLGELLDPYKEETKTFFAMREEAFQKKRKAHIEEYGDTEDFIKRKSVNRISKPIKVKKIKEKKPKKVKVIKEKKIKEPKVKKEKKVKVAKTPKYLFKFNSWPIWKLLSLMVIALTMAVIFASFVDAYNFKFVIFYYNNIDMNNQMAAFLMYVSIMSIIALIGWYLFMAKKVLVRSDGFIVLKKGFDSEKVLLSESDISTEKDNEHFTVIYNDLKINKIKSKYMAGFESAISEKPIITQ